MHWKFSSLQELIQKRYGAENATLFIEAAQSITWKLDMHNYHATESMRVLKEAIYNSEAIAKDTNESFAATKAIILSAIGDKQAPPLSIAIFEAEAHMIAAAQSLHSSADIMACTIYWAFGLSNSKGPLRIERLNLRNIAKYLSTNSVYNEITTAITSFLALPQFNYLSAFVNTTKHHSLVEMQFMANFVPNEPAQGILIKPFQSIDYLGNKINFDKLWGKEFLFRDGSIIMDSLIQIGIEISNYYSLN